MPATPQEVAILTADIGDAASMDALVRRSKVLIALAGPYAALGSAVVEACVRNSTHYVDITGASSFRCSLNPTIRRRPVAAVGCPGELGYAHMLIRLSLRVTDSRGLELKSYNLI